MAYSYNYCNCHQPQSVKQSLLAIKDELVEFVQEPSMDEFSDVMYGIGRLIAPIFGKSYVSMPGDKKHIFKINNRMVEHGCIRSKRHLVNGVCPSSPKGTKKFNPHI